MSPGFSSYNEMNITEQPGVSPRCEYIRGEFEEIGGYARKGRCMYFILQITFGHIRGALFPEYIMNPEFDII